MAAAVALLPGDFTGGRRAVADEPWDLFGEKYYENPRYLISDGDLEMVRLWRMYSGGMAAGHLPESGGTLDQAAIMMDAFSIISAAEEEIRKRVEIKNDSHRGRPTR